MKEALKNEYDGGDGIAGGIPLNIVGVPSWRNREIQR